MKSSSPIDLRSLNYFVVTAEESSFRKAAGRLHITPPGLSMQIKKLEDLLGVQLFERTPKKIHLTSEGRALLDEARVLLGNAEKFVGDIKNLATGKHGRLRIGMARFFGQGFITGAINAYQARYPDENLDCVDGGAERDMLEALARGRIHMGFTYDSRIPRMKGIKHLRVMDSPIHVLMEKRHPLAALEQIPLSALAGQSLVCLDNSWFDALNLPAFFQKEGLPAPRLKKFHNCNLCAIVETGGITLIPEKQTSSLCDKLVHRPIQDAASRFRVRLHAVWKKHAETAQMLNFLELLKRAGKS